jgi:membrane protein
MATPTQASHPDLRGRTATRPRDIPWQGWKDIARRVKGELEKDNMSFVAAGVAFYALLAVFPALAALVVIYGLVADPTDIEQQFRQFGAILPPDAQRVIGSQLQTIAGHASGALSLGLLVSLGFALWTASRGMTSLITALNIVYNEREQRNFWQLNGLSLLLTLGAILFAVVALGLVVGLPAVFNLLGIGGLVSALISLLAWPLLGVVFLLGLAVVYHYAPCRTRPRWDWTSPGAILATLLWLVGSVLFSFYVASFGNYNEVYGSVGAIVILLTWFYLTAYVILLGAEVNAEMEHQTAADTTEGPPEPLGERGAYVADTIGASPSPEDAGVEKAPGPDHRTDGEKPNPRPPA